MVNGDDRSAWVIGGATLIGVGVGLIFLSTSALWFVASVLIGIGSGLVIASLIKKDNDGKTGGINGQRARGNGDEISALTCIDFLTFRRVQ